MPMRSPAKPSHNRARPVFIGCPFDPDYKLRCALEYSDSGAVHLSIHDSSRVGLDADLGLRLAGPPLRRRRKTLILDADAHRDDKTLSDISGMDIEAHANDGRGMIRLVRNWLNTNRDPGGPPLPGGAAINEDHDTYLEMAPDIAASAIAKS